MFCVSGVPSLRVVQLDAVPVDARGVRNLVVEVHDHRVADLQPELGAGNRAVEREHADVGASVDVDAGGLGDDRGFDDVGIGILIDDEWNGVGAAVRFGEGRAGDARGNERNYR